MNYAQCKKRLSKRLVFFSLPVHILFICMSNSPHFATKLATIYDNFVVKVNHSILNLYFLPLSMQFTLHLFYFHLSLIASQPQIVTPRRTTLIAVLHNVSKQVTLSYFNSSSFVPSPPPVSSLPPLLHFCVILLCQIALSVQRHFVLTNVRCKQPLCDKWLIS